MATIPPPPAVVAPGKPSWGPKPSPHVSDSLRSDLEAWTKDRETLKTWPRGQAETPEAEADREKQLAELRARINQLARGLASALSHRPQRRIQLGTKCWYLDSAGVVHVATRVPAADRGKSLVR